MFGPSFKSVGVTDGTFCLKEMSYNAEFGGDTILLIDETTAAYTTLTFLTDTEAKENFGEDAIGGWYKEDDLSETGYSYAGNDKVNVGSAFWVRPGSGAVGAQVAGEVKTTFSRTFPNELYSAFANPFPVPMALKDFNYAAEYGGDTMLWIDKETAAYSTLTFLTDVEAKENFGDEAVGGWYKEDDQSETGYSYAGNDKLDPGQGVWIRPGSGAVTMTATLDIAK